MLNDLPENNHSEAVKNVSEGLKKYENVFIYLAAYDFSKQIFPNNYVDIAFSNMTVHIINSSPGPREPNVFFYATEEAIATDWGKKWYEAFRVHFKNFLD